MQKPKYFLLVPTRLQYSLGDRSPVFRLQEPFVHGGGVPSKNWKRVKEQNECRTSQKSGNERKKEQ